ncbi:MAG TPA: transposase [Candidatus Tectomicrobia bacterium]|jgi:transposase
MTEPLTLTTERVDDIPLLLAHLERMGLQPLLDAHFPTHGNWVGLSLGWVSVLWLTHILSEGDHRLNHVAPWAKQRLHTLRECTEQPVHPLDVSDDRLATVLAAVSDDMRWSAFEGALNQHALRVYDLQPACVRLDSTTANGHWSVTEDGLFQFGHSKDHRPDLPQVKIMVSALDPLGMPVATDIVPGQRADDPLYVPAIARVREGLGRRGLLYVGDCKMAALETRAFLQAGGDYYLCPLSEIQVPPAVLTSYLAPVWTEEQALTVIHRAEPGGPSKLIAEGFERREPVTAEVAGNPYSWLERRLIIRSFQLAQAGERGLRTRLTKAQAAVTALNTRGRGQRRGADPGALREAVEAILARYRVQGLLHVRYKEQWWEQPLRRYGGRDATMRLEWDVQVTLNLDEEAVATAVRQLGWRVYATTQPSAQLSLQEAVLAYRNEYLVERAMGRLKGRPLSLTPMYLERDDHATGLIRLLSLGLRALTLLEFGVRRRLATAKTTLAGLYVGNPKRATAHPTAERLLEAFQGLTLTVIREGRRRRRHLTPLSRVHQRILTLLDFPVATYMRLCPDSHKPP